jgi:hypothetical protein
MVFGISIAATVLFGSTALHGQTRTGMNLSALADEYLAPNVPQALLELYKGHIPDVVYLPAHVKINRHGDVREIEFGRLLGLGLGNSAPEHTVFNACEEAIRDVSKSWNFRTLASTVNFDHSGCDIFVLFAFEVGGSESVYDAVAIEPVSSGN